MKVNRVISYKNAWATVNAHHEIELSEITETMNFVYEEIKKNAHTEAMVVLQRNLLTKAWDVNQQVIGVGIVKNKVSVATSRSRRNFMNYLFQHTFQAIESGFINLPILTTFCETDKVSFESLITPIEEYETILTDIAPLSHRYPFLILGYSNIVQDLHLTEIPEVTTELSKVIDKSIEFPPEYHQAGLGILNYFATYLREQYPQEQAKVKIEQDGLIVRLIVENRNGESKIIEKALHEYELIITGEEKPEAFINNSSLVLGLKNKLEIAKVEIRMQQNLISMQNDRIDDLLKILGQGLASKNLIDFRPHIIVNNEVTTTIVTEVQNDIGELLKMIDKTSDIYSELNKMAQQLDSIKSERNPEVLKKSEHISKLKNLIDSIAEGKTLAQKTIKAVEGGWDIFKSVGKKYNSIAELCGLPQVPSLLLK